MFVAEAEMHSRDLSAILWLDTLDLLSEQGWWKTLAGTHVDYVAGGKILFS
jgi:hypothetical protein